MTIVSACPRRSGRPSSSLRFADACSEPRRVDSRDLFHIPGPDPMPGQLALISLVPDESGRTARMHACRNHISVLHSCRSVRQESGVIQVDYLLLADAAAASEGKHYIHG